MTKEQINKLQSAGEFPGNQSVPELVETHISWVLLCEQFVYKIKKPIQYSFLDFSSIEKRKYYCEREIELNKRLSDGIYLDVQGVREINGCFSIGNENGELIDWAVRMHKLDKDRQMDKLLLTNQVSEPDMLNLAKKIAGFHKSATIIYQKDYLDVQTLFNDLATQTDYLKANLNVQSGIIINRAIDISNQFIDSAKSVLENRLKNGFFRDCHGDLHSRNIFLLPAPQPFDCLEFNDDLRQIDVLNEIAFLCMDLDAFGRQDLSDSFLQEYNRLFPCLRSEDDQRLFVYYKSYRANIRAKVNSLRAGSAVNDGEKSAGLAEAEKYLQLMDSYIQML